MCGLDSVKVEYGCEEDKICIYFPGGPCRFVEKVPVIFKVDGAVYVKSCSDELRVRVVMNLTLPINEESVRHLIPIIEDDRYSWLADMFRSNTSVTVTTTEYVIVQADGIPKVYQYGEEVEFSPFYIVYPRNATHVKEVVENQISIRYYGFPLEFEMLKLVQVIRKYKRPLETREVSYICASMIAPSVRDKLEDALTKPYYEMVVYEPSVMYEDLLSPVLDLLLGEDAILSLRQSYGYFYSPYNETYLYKLELAVGYVDHYSLYIHMPVKAQRPLALKS